MPADRWNTGFVRGRDSRSGTSRNARLQEAHGRRTQTSLYAMCPLLWPVKIASVVGARPQFIKAAPVSREIRQHHEEILVHTGQHYDENMSDVFFEVLDMPRPDYNLGVGSGSHSRQTAEMMHGLEDVFEREKPDLVFVYGDTNSTLAGALVASKMGRPLGHVEAGLRSFNRSMPEEINRVVADHLSALLFCPTQTAVDNLAREGISRGVHLVGDVMYDVALQSAQAARSRDILQRFGVRKGEYILVTLHRPASVDDRETLEGIVEALVRCGRTVVFPIHPRTRKNLGACNWSPSRRSRSSSSRRCTGSSGRPPSPSCTPSRSSGSLPSRCRRPRWDLSGSHRSPSNSECSRLPDRRPRRGPGSRSSSCTRRRRTSS